MRALVIYLNGAKMEPSRLGTTHDVPGISAARRSLSFRTRYGRHRSQISYIYVIIAGAAQRTNNERQTARVMLGAMAGGENRRRGQPENNWVLYLVAGLRVFRATQGPTESVPFVFGVETVLWPAAAKKGGKELLKRRNVS